MAQPVSRLKLFLILLIISTIFCVSFLICIGNGPSPQEPFFEHEFQNQRVYVNGELPWYFSSGTLQPDPKLRHNYRVWPEQLRSDRIAEQLMLTATTSTIKYINVREWDGKLETSQFTNCPVNQCAFISDQNRADAVLFKNRVPLTRKESTKDQIWIFYQLESPYVYAQKNIPSGIINWTATYREDSDIVTPYEKWMYYNDSFQQFDNLTRNYAAGKTKKVAWFVSNCRAQNERMEYALELQQYIDVDIYGSCGTLKCSKKEKECNELLNRDYKFYLAFENANCRDYVTEKLFVNGLKNDVIPIVMGAHQDDYRRVAPQNSFIHVDDFPTPRDLADYLDMLDDEDELYNAFFRWKGTGEFINTHFFCRVCALLHTPRAPHYYNNLSEWWSKESICRKDGWTN